MEVVEVRQAAAVVTDQVILSLNRRTRLGKKVFQEHVICESCPYADLEHTSESVASVWGQLKKDLKRRGTIGENLKRKERRSVTAFIRKRFRTLEFNQEHLTGSSFRPTFVFP